MEGQLQFSWRHMVWNAPLFLATDTINVKMRCIFLNDLFIMMSDWNFNICFNTYVVMLFRIMIWLYGYGAGFTWMRTSGSLWMDIRILVFGWTCLTSWLLVGKKGRWGWGRLLRIIWINLPWFCLDLVCSLCSFCLLLPRVLWYLGVPTLERGGRKFE